MCRSISLSIRDKEMYNSHVIGSEGVNPLLNFDVLQLEQPDWNKGICWRRSRSLIKNVKQYILKKTQNFNVFDEIFCDLMYHNLNFQFQITTKHLLIESYKV